MRRTMFRLAAVAALALGTLAIDGVNSREAEAGCVADKAAEIEASLDPMYFWLRSDYLAFWWCFGYGDEYTF